MDKNISIFSHTFISELYMLQTHLDKVTIFLQQNN